MTENRTSEVWTKTRGQAYRSFSALDQSAHLDGMCGTLAWDFKLLVDQCAESVKREPDRQVLDAEFDKEPIGESPDGYFQTVLTVKVHAIRLGSKKEFVKPIPIAENEEAAVKAAAKAIGKLLDKDFRAGQESYSTYATIDGAAVEMLFEATKEEEVSDLPPMTPADPDFPV